MEYGILILTMSLAVQLGAALYALNLIRATGHKLAWGLIALALLLMALRRGITWVHVVFQGEEVVFDLHAELTALTISVLMLVGTLLIGRLFQSIQRDRKRLITAVENMPVLLDAFDRDGTIVFWNQACETATGYTAADIVGNSNALELLYPDPEYRDWVVSTIRKEDGDFANLDFELTTKDGEKRVISWTNISDTVTIPGWSTWAIGIDVTERHSAEDRLHQTIDELTRSNTELERFAFIVSHDLQEPTRSMVNYSQLLERRLGTRLEEDDREIINFVIDGAKRMNDLVRDILDYSRAGRSEDAFAPLRLSAALNEALSNLRTTIEETSAEIVATDLPTVNGNRTLITQLLQNLIANGIKFRSPDRPCRINITAEPQDDRWLITVRDNGIGIAPQYHGQIFDIFKRLHTITDYPGTGVGLAVAKRIVERHGGRIWVDSTADDGAVFRFTLPPTA